MPEHENPEAKILQATIECINQDGIQGVTVRRIAELAGVNVAAINYYYRSKDRLIAAAMERTLHNAFDEWMEIIRDRTRPLRARYLDILREMVWGVDLYPGLSRAHIYEPVMEGNQESLAAQWFKRFLELVLSETQAALPHVSLTAIRSGLAQLFATALFVPLAPTIFATVQPFSLTEDEGRLAFVDWLLDSFFRNLGKG